MREKRTEETEEKVNGEKTDNNYREPTENNKKRSHADKKLRIVVSVERGNGTYKVRMVVGKKSKKRKEHSEVVALHAKEIIFILDVTSLFTSVERKRCGSRNSQVFNLIHCFYSKYFGQPCGELLNFVLSDSSV